MRWKKIALSLLLFIAVERFCFFQTGTFSLSKMIYEKSPPSPTSTTSPVHLEQPLRFLGAGKQFYAFETADEKYVVKFMKWSRRRPLPILDLLHLDAMQASRARLAHNLQQSGLNALNHLPHETQLVTPQPTDHFTLIDKLGITHTIPASSTHYYVQRKATPFPTYFKQKPSKEIIASFIHTVATQCRLGFSNLDPLIDRNYGVVDDQIILLDIGSFLQSPKLHHTAAIQHEIVLELIPLRAYLQENAPEYVAEFDKLLKEELKQG